MAEEKVLVVGLGEVSRPLFELLRDSGRFAVHGIDVDEAKMRELEQNRSSLPNEIDIMYICIPCWNKEEFINVIIGYVKRFKPKLLIINSTVLPGTKLEVDKCCGGCLVVHSPVQGVHKNLNT